MATCQKWYFNNLENTLSLIDVVEGVYDSDNQTISLYFPYPFQLLGLSDVEEWDTSPPFTEIPMNLSFVLKSTAIQNANAKMIQQIFSVMMYANRDVGKYPDSPFLGAITYTEKALGIYNNYFKQWLSDESSKSYFYNQFLFNGYLIRKFWADEVTIADPETVQQRLLELTERLFNTSDRRLWGAPGLYTMYIGDPIETANIYAYETSVINVND